MPQQSHLAARPSVPTRPSVVARLWLFAEAAIDRLALARPAAQLLARWYVGSVFFRSGLTKLRDWDITLALFHDEYHVPLLDPNVAAWLGTIGEIGLPVLLVLGLGGRFAAAGLFVVNLIAVASLSDIADAALQQHVFWGSLLAGLLLWGPGGWSADRFVAPWLRRRLLGDAPASPAAVAPMASRRS